MIAADSCPEFTWRYEIKRSISYDSFFSSTRLAGSTSYLTKPQYAVMRAIADKPGIEQVALIEAAVSTKATLAEMLARMENRGLVRREHDAADKRRRFVWLTAEGEKILAAAIPIGDSVDEEFLGRLSAEEQELFVQLVRKMMNT